MVGDDLFYRPSAYYGVPRLRTQSSYPILTNSDLSLSPSMSSQGAIEALNALSIAGFRTHFGPFYTSFITTKSIDSQSWLFDLQSSCTISKQDMNSCFDLIKESSSNDYAASSLGWHPAKKRREMRLPDLKYVLVKPVWQISDWERDVGRVGGFMSFMLTYEDGIDVIYCYEIHLKPCYQDKGLGTCLIQLLKEVGKKAGVQKAMLTVFRVNQTARTFYEKLGYREDEYSPQPKKLRGGIVKESDYIILSKTLVDDAEDLTQKGSSELEGRTP